jgi:hypothetical protein
MPDNDNGYLPLVAGAELVRLSGELAQADPLLLLGTLPPAPEPDPEEE